MEKDDDFGGFTIMEAVDNLSLMAELDVTSAPEEISPFLENPDAVRATFRVLLSYLMHIYQKEKGELKDPEMQRGIQAMMVLANEAAQKMDRAGKEVSTLQEYQDLQKFYLEKVVKRFRTGAGSAEEWEKQWEGAKATDVQKKGLKDLEAVRKDRNYELFFIRKENGKPFFHPELLRHLRLVGEFDETLTDPEGDDPLLQIRELEDRDAHETAKEILHRVSPYLDEFYKEALRHKGREFAMQLNQATMALMLAADPRNVVPTTGGKSALSYFADFYQFLRDALKSLDYNRTLTVSQEETDAFSRVLLSLVHAFSSALFMRCASRKDAVKFIKKLIERAPHEKRKKAESIWEEVVQEDEKIRYVLKQHPSGPLLKTLDYFRAHEEGRGFDPLLQETPPSQLYIFSNEDLHVTILRLPAPIHQEVIDRAEVTEEFRAFLRALQTQMKGQRHLLLDLQDRTSWQERARCIALEGLQKDAEFSSVLSVVTLGKSHEFYEQSGPYQHLTDAQEFLNAFYEQIVSGEACGYFFPSGIELHPFAKSMQKLIHELFFASKETFTRKERQDFIEIFDQFLYLKLILLLKPDSLSFTCKDALDIGEAQAAGFFAFLRMMGSQEAWTQEEKEFLLWMLYSPALLVRERPIDSAPLQRMIGALKQIESALEENRKEILTKTQELLGVPIFKKLTVRPA